MNPNLNPQQFYHGSDRVFGTGDEIDPARSRPRVQEMHGGAYAFATTDPKEAAGFGRHVYPVQPQGAMERDPHMHSGTEYRTTGRLTVTQGDDNTKTFITNFVGKK
jgi:hypothetical protein